MIHMKVIVIGHSAVVDYNHCYFIMLKGVVERSCVNAFAISVHVTEGLI